MTVTDWETSMSCFVMFGSGPASTGRANSPLLLRWLRVSLHSLPTVNCLVGLVAKASTSRAADPRFDSRLRRREFSGSSHTSDFKIGTPVATLPGAWRYKVSTGTGWPVSVNCDWVRWKVLSATSISGR